MLLYNLAIFGLAALIMLGVAMLAILCVLALRWIANELEERIG